MALSDSDLVEKARRGDEEAFETLVRRYLRPAHAVAIAIVRDSADAEDVVQDGFIRALEQLDTCQPERFAAWLMRIMRNRAISLHRKKKVRASMPLEWANGIRSRSDPAHDAERAGTRERLSEAIESLPERQREVLLLHDLEGWKHREIGDALDMKEGTVRYTLFQARRAVRARLGAESHKEI